MEENCPMNVVEPEFTAEALRNSEKDYDAFKIFQEDIEWAVREANRCGFYGTLYHLSRNEFVWRWEHVPRIKEWLESLGFGVEVSTFYENYKRSADIFIRWDHRVSK